MDQFPELSFEAFAGLEHDSTRLLVLTVNNRHARRLVADLAAHMGDRPVRQMPRILPLSAWMRQAAEALVHVPQADMASHVLDAFGAQQVWRQVIDEQEAQRPLLDTAQAARLAMDADRLLSDWQLQVPEGAETAEYARFLDWRDAYRAHLLRLDAQDDNLLQEAVLHAAGHDALPLPFETVILVGFSELSPRVLALLHHLQRQGRQVMLLRQAWARAEEAVRVACDDPDAQWRDAAAWAACELRANPQGRFAIVAAQLESDMAFAHRVLRQALGADAVGDNGGHADTPLSYNIAVARPLAEWPMVRAALAWLRALAVLARRPSCDPQTLGEALLAGACAGETAEASGRAGIDARWRRKGVLQVSRQDLQERLAGDAPQLAQAWQDALAQVASAGASATLDAWSVRFRQDLHALGFPGDAGQDSAAFQTLQALDEALDRFAGQAFAFGAVRRDEALSVLDRLLRQSTFQPMRDPSARLDVLGMLEADGGHWDAVWVLGLNDDVLPAVPRPNPLLPLPVLRQAGTPRATPARELQWAQSMFDALLCCAPRIVFSHARRQGEQPLRPSPFVQGLTERHVSDLAAACQTGAGRADAQVSLEALWDLRGPSLSGDRPMRGGIAVIDTQSRNPLWAFAKYRLGASLLPDYAEAADANTRGNFLHHGIELVWRMLPDRDALLQQIENGTLETLIAQAVEQAAQAHLQDYGDALRDMEMQRAQGVLLDWLDAEGRRAPFAIRALEQSDTWRDGPLELRVRLDRIDVLPDGRLIVMDYKTGAGGIDPRNDWMRDRPVNLQLPFYAAMLEQEQGHVAALVLARLHARAVELRGLADGDDLGLPGVATPSDWPLFVQDGWADVMRHWRGAITLLARELADGEAANVVRRPSDLDYCDVLPFLRLGEAQVADEETRHA